MKNIVKAIATFVVVMAAVVMVPLTADAAPAGLQQTGATDSAIKFSWGADPAANYYHTCWSTDGVTWSQWERVYGGPEESIYSLNAGSTYQVKVRSVLPDGSFQESQPLEVVTAPDGSQIKDIAVSAATTDSLSFTWTACPGATSYAVYDYTTDQLIANVSEPSFTKNGLAADTAYGIKVFPVRTSSAGYAARDSYGKSLSNVYTKPNKPAAPSTGAFGLGSTFYNINIAYLTANRPAGVDGYEIEVYQVKDNKKVFTADSSNYRMEVKKNMAYKYRCRYYVTYANDSNDRTYSDWSGYRYFWFHNVQGKYNSKRIKVSWGKIAKASSYTVYISTSEKGGYKKVKTLNSKKTSITIRKYGKKKLKKNKKYYVKVVAKVKDGKKTVGGDYNFVGSANM